MPLFQMVLKIGANFVSYDDKRGFRTCRTAHFLSNESMVLPGPLLDPGCVVYISRFSPVVRYLALNNFTFLSRRIRRGCPVWGLPYLPLYARHHLALWYDVRLSITVSTPKFLMSYSHCHISG